MKSTLKQKGLMKTIVVMLAIVSLVCQVLHAQGTLYLSNLDQISTGSVAVASDSWLAANFRTGNNTPGYLLNSVDLAMGNAAGNPSGFTVMIYSDVGIVGSMPGSSLGTLSGSENPTTADVYNYAPTSDVMLSANTHYFIVLVAGTATSVGAYGWSITDTPTVSSNGWSANTSLTYSSNGSSWSFLSGDLAQFALTATAIPEPTSVFLLLIGGGAFTFARRRFNG